MYLYLDKELLTNLHNQGKITDDQFDAVKVTVNAALENFPNQDFDTIQKKLEKYKLIDLTNNENIIVDLEHSE